MLDEDEFWDESQIKKPARAPFRHITKEAAAGIAHNQYEKWKKRMENIDDEDELIEARDCYQLLADQARLFISIIARIKL